MSELNSIVKKVGVEETGRKERTRRKENQCGDQRCLPVPAVLLQIVPDYTAAYRPNL